MGLGTEGKNQVYFRSLLHDAGTIGPPPHARPLVKVSGDAVDASPYLPDPSGTPGLPPDLLPPASPPGDVPGRIITFADQVEIRLMEGKEGKRDVLRSSRRWPVSREDVAVWEAFRDLADQDGFWASMKGETLAESVKQHRPRPLPLTEEGHESFIAALADLIDSKSYFTARHSRRVSDMALRLAVLMGLDPSSREELRLAGLFHDLGKLAVPREILDKPGRLSEEEYQVVKKHSLYTQTILERVSGYGRIAALAGSHHERLDGKGYHRRLRGKQVSLGTRILTAADAYDALTSIRPYRYGLSPEKALDVIDKEAEGHFDPNVVVALRRAVAG